MEVPEEPTTTWESWIDTLTTEIPKVGTLIIKCQVIIAAVFVCSEALALLVRLGWFLWVKAGQYFQQGF